MHKFKISDQLKNVLNKLSKRDKQLYEKLLKKIEEVINCPDVEHYKNLRYSLKESKRVHVGHFVLIFTYDQKNDEIYFDDFEHHDMAYRL